MQCITTTCKMQCITTISSHNQLATVTRNDTKVRQAVSTKTR